MNHRAKNRRNVLFVCSKNRWRSPTAEHLYRDDFEISVRSRGTASDAERTLSPADVQWADMIVVMESKHKQRILADYPDESKFKEFHVLDIPDDYRYMDPDLVTMIRQSVDALL